MGYTIHYGPEPKIAKRLRNPNYQVWIIAAMLTFTVILANYFRPKEMQLLKETLFPWTQPAVKSAFSDFITDIRQGETLHDAAEAFCLEILANAEN